ncbi:unnamed protein product [Thelazia callipaeda]|uniref:Tyrosine-protein phosphatase domain-containing protein n=1 Tax=Thelazia callipaeda TaxID=103827 RepID=A0A0N5CNK5_THECL|nr:unnamed protein product [Thelazia callipaeda]
MISERSTQPRDRYIYFHVQNTEHAGISQVLPGLYLSGICALQPATIQEHGITMIVNATSEVPNILSLDRIVWMKLWMKNGHRPWPVSYMESICQNKERIETNQIKQLVLKILTALSRGDKVLIHSVQGTSRCATVCLALLTKSQFKTLRDAYKYLASVRPKVEPDIFFWRQLISFEQKIKRNNGSVKIVRDERDTSLLLPDVYREFALQREGNLNNNKVERKSIERGNHCCKQKITDREIIIDEEKGVKRKVPNQLEKTRSVSCADVDEVIIGVESVAVTGRRSRLYRRKMSWGKKFRPVLEPLIEVL